MVPTDGSVGKEQEQLCLFALTNGMVRHVKGEMKKITQGNR